MRAKSASMAIVATKRFQKYDEAWYGMMTTRRDFIGGRVGFLPMHEADVTTQELGALMHAGKC